MQIGSNVRLNSGGPLMVITSMEAIPNAGGMMVICMWLNTNGEPQFATFPAACVTMANSAPRFPDDVQQLRNTSVINYPHSSL